MEIVQILYYYDYYYYYFHYYYYFEFTDWIIEAEAISPILVELKVSMCLKLSLNSQWLSIHTCFQEY